MPVRTCKKEGLLTVHKRDEMRGDQRRVKMRTLVKFQMGRKISTVIAWEQITKRVEVGKGLLIIG
jgi:hypothetical protein